MSILTRRKKRELRHEKVMAMLRAGQCPDLSSKEQIKLANTISRKKLGARKALGPHSAYDLRSFVANNVDESRDRTGADKEPKF